jgi:hypothetical protein
MPAALLAKRVRQADVRMTGKRVGLAVAANACLAPHSQQRRRLIIESVRYDQLS